MPFDFAQGTPESIYITQTEMLQYRHRSAQLFIGIPKENTLQETRVPLIPNAVATIASSSKQVQAKNPTLQTMNTPKRVPKFRTVPSKSSKPTSF
jgi:hypothetical protein